MAWNKENLNPLLFIVTNVGLKYNWNSKFKNEHYIKTKSHNDFEFSLVSLKSLHMFVCPKTNCYWLFKISVQIFNIKRNKVFARGTSI